MQGEQIEILMAAYNGAPYIREQLDSIVSQTDPNWLLTISDDGSTDGTDAIIDEYVRRFPDRIRRVRSGRRFGGAKAHFFWLTAQCDAAYIAYCDDDDTWRPGKLERLRAAMTAAEAELGSDTPVLVFSDQTVTDDSLHVMAPSLMRYQKQRFERFDYRGILMQNVVTGGAMMVNRALARLALACADVSQAAMHDWWLALVAARFGRIVYIDEPLGAYRQHGDNSVGAKNVGSAAYARRMIASPARLRQTLLGKKAQARVFANTYADRLGGEDEAFLSGFVRPHSGPLFYWKHRALICGLHRLAGMMLLG